MLVLMSPHDGTTMFAKKVHMCGTPMLVGWPWNLRILVV